MPDPLDEMPDPHQGIDAVRPNTPISMQNEMWEYQEFVTDIDIPAMFLEDEFPDEDFNSEAYQRIVLPRYLSGLCSRRDAFLMYNQLQEEMIARRWNKPIRMRNPVNVRYSKVYHPICIDQTSDNNVAKGIITVCADTSTKFCGLMIENPKLFFCGECDTFIFEMVDYYNDKQFAKPEWPYYPTCEVMFTAAVLTPDPEYNYVEVLVQDIRIERRVGAERSGVRRQLDF